MTRIFLAGAAGVIGRRLTPLLLAHGHSVWGSTRSTQNSELLRNLGARRVVVDVFDADALADSGP
jgi:nucleoside-diphosphate-sugar epimerase